MNYAENRSDSVATYTASDADGDNISWSLPNTFFEFDRSDFSISSSGVLTFDSSPNHESPHDHNGDNVYLVTVRASDASGGTYDRNVTITVRDVNERPEVVSRIDDRTMTAGTSTTISLVGRFSDPDSDTLIYTAASSDARVVITSVSGGTLSLAAVSAGSATITVTAADRSSVHTDRLSATDDFTVTVELPPPGMPENLTYTPTRTEGTVRVDWDAVSDATG